MGLEAAVAAAAAAGELAAVLARGSLRVGALGPSSWGWQGRYTEDPITGYWPEYLQAILGKFNEAYVDGTRLVSGIALERVWNSSSDGSLVDSRRQRVAVCTFP